MPTDFIERLVYSEKDIQHGVAVVAQQLNEKYDDAVMITVVPGGMLFTADLARQLTFPISMDVISCPHMPGDRSNTSDIVFRNTIDLTGRHVIVVDDAIESGGTMKRLVSYLTSTYVLKSIAIATLFVKKNRTAISVDQHFAYEYDGDDMLVGYGLPWNDGQRNLPFVAKLAEGERGG